MDTNEGYSGDHLFCSMCKHGIIMLYTWKLHNIFMSLIPQHKKKIRKNNFQAIQSKDKWQCQEKIMN